MKRIFTTVAVCVALATLAGTAPGRPAAAGEAVSFAGKTINMSIGFGAGSGVDLYGRIVGRHLAEALPGKPSLIVLNQVGAGGVAPLNSWVAKSVPIGLDVAIVAQSQIDPEAIFRTDAKYDPVKLEYIGGVAGPSQALFVSKEAVGRLTDKSQKPVVMAIVGSTLRTGYYQVLWGVAFLGWNVKWVPGYRETSDVKQAMERGEADMSAFGTVNDIKYMLGSGKFTIVSQSGSRESGSRVGRDAIGDVPIMANQLKGKITDPMARQAFEYSENVLQIGKWLALPPRTPEPIVAAYVKGFEAMLMDPNYQKEIEKTDPDSPIARRADMERLVRELTTVSPATIEFIHAEMKRQGL